jgi:hypothetical protein
MLRLVFCPASAFGVIALLGGCSLDGRAVGVKDGAGAESGATGLGGAGGSSAGSAGLNAGSGGLNTGGVAGDSGVTGNGAGAEGIAGAAGLAGGGGTTSGGGDAGSSSMGGSVGGDAGPDEPQLPSCAAQALTGLGSAAATTTAAGDGAFSLACGVGNSDDASIYWVAPEAGYYSIDTFGSSFDTVLGVVSASCDGTELACNDDGGAEAPQSEIVREFAAGEEVVFVVDGKSGSFGDAVVNTHAVTCPAIDTKRQALPLAATTLDGTDDHGGACGGDGQLEKTFRWQAPAGGLYRFTASADALALALYVERGPRCGGELLGCNAGGFSGAATVVRRLSEGDVVTLIVEGTDGPGNFELNVEDISANACPDQPEIILFDDTVDSGVLNAGDPSVLTGSCVPARQRILPGGEFDLPEHAYPLTIEDAFCNVVISADGPVAVYVLDGLSCGGSELYCQTFEAPDFEVVSPSFGDIGVGPQSFVVVVESSSPVTNDISYTLDFLCAIP